MKFRYLGLLVGVILTCVAHVDASQQRSFVRGLYYLDSREFNTFNLTAIAPDIGMGWSYFGLIDLHSTQKDAKNRFDLTRFLLDTNVAHPIHEVPGLSTVIRYLDFPGGANGVWRAGLSYPVIQGLTVQVLPIQTQSGGQVSLLYNFPISDSLTLNGFADLDWASTMTSTVVNETQLTFTKFLPYVLQIEIRYNGYEDRTPGQSGFGIALGGGYLF